MDDLASFRLKLAKLLRGEEGLFPTAHVPPLDLPVYQQRHSNQMSQSEDEHMGHTASTSASLGSVSSLTKLLTEECIRHFVQVDLSAFFCQGLGE